jgi:hypothetical protein
MGYAYKRLGERVREWPDSGYSALVMVRVGVPPEQAFQVFLDTWPDEILSSDAPRRCSGDGWEAQFEPVVEGGTRVQMHSDGDWDEALERFADAAARA